MTNPTEHSFWDGLKRVLNSSQVHVTASALVGAWFAARHAAASMPPQQAAEVWMTFFAALGVMVREVLNTFAEQDVEKLRSALGDPRTLEAVKAMLAGFTSGSGQTNIINAETAAPAVKSKERYP